MANHSTVSGRNHLATRSDIVLPGPVLGTSCAVPISFFPPVTDPVQAWRRRVRPPPYISNGHMSNLVFALPYCKVHTPDFCFTLRSNASLLEVNEHDC